MNTLLTDRCFLTRLCGLSLASWASVASCQAQLVSNPGFETGLTGWTTAGDTTTQTALYGVTPDSGLSQAVITNDSVTQHPGAILTANLESFLGLSAGSLSATGNGKALEGSAILQQINGVQAGQTLTFAYDFLTAESKETPQTANDFAFMLVRPALQTGDQSSIVTLATVTSLYNGPTVALGGLTPAQIEFRPPGLTTGYQPFTYTFPSSGNYVLAFGVLDVGPSYTDWSRGNSGLIVDSISLTAVPEPQQWAIIASLGLCAAAVWRRRNLSQNALRLS